VRGGDNLTTFTCQLSWKSGNLNPLNRLGHTGPVTDCFTFTRNDAACLSSHIV